MSQQLPVTAILYDAVSLPFRYFRDLLNIGAPLLFVMFVAVLFASLSLEVGDSYFSNIGIAFLSIAYITTALQALVGAHRLFLNKRLPSEERVFNWTGNEVRFAGWSLLLIVCVALVSLPVVGISGVLVGSMVLGENSPQLVAQIVSLAITFPVYYFVGRWSLVLPASAIGIRGKSLSWAWNLSDGNGWRLALLMGLLPICNNMLLSLIAVEDSWLFAIFSTALSLLVATIQVGVLSLSYKYLTDNQVDEEEEDKPQIGTVEL